MKGVGEKGTEDGALSRLRGQGRGLRGVGGEQEECPLDLGIQKAAALEGQAHGLARAVACVNVWALTRHSFFFTEFSSFNPTAGLGATSLSQVRPRSGLKVLCDPQSV